MRLKYVAALILSILAAFSYRGLAVARTAVCADRVEVLRKLQSEFSERPVGRGLTVDGALLEVIRSSETGSWTIILTAPGGTTCLLAAGEDWQMVEPLPAGRSM